MINRDNDFFRMSKRIAEDFLQSTVIVDDFVDGRNRDVTAILQEPAGRPSIGKREQVPDETPSIGPDFANGDARREINYYFDDKTVINACARKGIVCSVIRPQAQDSDGIIELIGNLADCADILVFDWSLHNDEGEKALEMLANILRSERDQQVARLRLLVIYTGDPKVDRIPDRVRSHLKAALDIDPQEKQHGFAMTYGGTRIVILAKPERDKIPAEYHDRVVEFEDLVERLTDEFTVITAGLVSNVVLASFASVRRNTSKVLRRFSPRLDPSFLTHRFMLQDPSEAEEHLVTLISEELHGILEEERVGSKADIGAIESRLVSANFSGLTLRGKKCNSSDIVTALRAGIDSNEFTFLDADQKKKLKSGLHKEKLSTQFSLSDLEAPMPDEAFAYLTSMRSYYEQTEPMLTQGTLVKTVHIEGSPEYLVCIQARCDSVRIESARAYPFLPLKIVPSDSEKKFDVILKEGDEHKRLLLGDNPKPYELRLIRFTANDHQTVRAKRLKKNEKKENEKNYYFVTEDDREYEWVGEFKFAHAQRLSNRLGATLSRVGVDESEWLRLWAKSGQGI